MFFSINIWSDVLLPDLKSACSGLSFSSSPFLILSISICSSILLGIDIKVMPLQFSLFVKSPFLGSVISRLLPILLVSLLLPISHRRSSSAISAAVSISAFSNSPVILSIPGTLFCFSFRIAPVISSKLIGLVFILLFSTPGSVSIHPFGGSQFST